MHCTALTACLSTTSADGVQVTTLQNLHAVFATLPDPRRAHGQRYLLAFLLTCLVAALLCNCNSTCAVSQWCHEQRALVRRVFGAQRHLTPSDSLYRWLLPRLDAEDLEAALSAWVQTTRPADDTEAVAVDGKSARRYGRRPDGAASAGLLHARDASDLAASPGERQGQ